MYCSKSKFHISTVISVTLMAESISQIRGIYYTVRALAEWSLILLHVGIFLWRLCRIVNVGGPRTDQEIFSEGDRILDIQNNMRFPFLDVVVEQENQRSSSINPQFITLPKQTPAVKRSSAPNKKSSVKGIRFSIRNKRSATKVLILQEAQRNTITFAQAKPPKKRAGTSIPVINEFKKQCYRSPDYNSNLLGGSHPDCLKLNGGKKDSKRSVNGIFNSSASWDNEKVKEGCLVAKGHVDDAASEEKGFPIIFVTASSSSNPRVEECNPSQIPTYLSMKLLVWNCQGMGSSLTRLCLKDLYVHNSVSIICLFETKAANPPSLDLRRLGFVNWKVVPPCGKSGGIMLCWKEEANLIIQATNKNFIHCCLSCPGDMNKPPFFITFVYGCPVEAEREALWDYISESVRPGANVPWCLIGDFNEVEVAYEKSGYRNKSPRAMQRFNCFLDFNGLMDIESKGVFFTWSNNRKGVHNVRQKLDRAVCNVEWLSLFPNTWVLSHPAIGSDHSPIVLDTDIPIKGKKRFRFEAFWLDNPECANTVHCAWSNYFRGSPSDILSRKINICINSLKKWSKSTFQNASVEISLIKNAISNLQNMSYSDDNNLRIKELTDKLESVWDREEKYWALRSRIKWLEWGDKNTAFFHASTNLRRAHNRILRLEYDANKWTESPREIRDIIQNHFRNLFTSKGTKNMLLVLDCVKPVVSEEANNKLIACPSLEEIKAAVWDLGAKKAPGPDGLSGLFYRHFWDIISSDICNTVWDFFLHGNLHPSLNRTNIALIPKVKQPIQVSQFRPISCINFSYKIIAKIMANRLRPFMNEWVSPNQAAFIKGRVIQDNIIIAQEFGHALSHRNRVGHPFAAVKLDMNKAYDQVEWPFLQAILIKLGFSETWVDRVMTCVRTVSFSILVNGQTLPFFSPSRGLRQGDPLSPFLFTLITEGLSSVIQHHLDNKLLTGVKLSPSCPPITHLLFADDSIFFIPTTYQDAVCLKKCLNSYCDASGQSINLNKSSIVFSKDSTLDGQNTVLDVLNIAPSGLIGKYLGLPAEWGKSKIQSSQWLIDKIQDKIKGWKHAILSQAGKEILIKSVVQAIPNYVMSVLMLPKSVYKKIDSLISRFWWGKDGRKGIYWVKWGSLTKPKGMGGVGFKDMAAKNLSLISGQVWRLHNNPHSLSARTIKGLYHSRTPILNANINKQGSWCWRSIAKGIAFLRSHCRVLIGDGKDTNIWKHQWIPNCPSLQKPIGCRFNKVNDLLNQDKTWNLNILNGIFPHNVVTKIVSLPRSPNLDRTIWPDVNSGSYNVKSGYATAVNLTNTGRDRDTQSLLSAHFWKTFWSIKVPPKVLSFMWKVLHNGIAVSKNLTKRGCSVNPYCDICKQAEENVEHLFFFCDFSRAVWLCSSFGFRFDVNEPVSFVAWLKDVMSQFHNKTSLAENVARIFNLCWWIWLSRNSRLFHKSSKHPRTTVQEAECAIREYWSVNKISFDAPSDEVSRKINGWIPPPQGRIKINCDASFCASSGLSKVAAVARNDKGDFVKALTISLSAEKPIQSEGQACLLGCVLALQMGLENCLIESDCKKFVDQIYDREDRDWTCLNTFELCNQVISKGVVANFYFCHRSANRVAHYLAASIPQGQFSLVSCNSPSREIIKWLSMDICNLS